jgi:hypothetical protein
VVRILALDIGKYKSFVALGFAQKLSGYAG